MGEVIVITSGKGGVGKTTTVANIGTGLAMMGKKTVVVDTDIGLRNARLNYRQYDPARIMGGKYVRRRPLPGKCPDGDGGFNCVF